MKYIIKYTLKPGCRDKLLDAFELHGPTRLPGISFQNAWFDTRSNVAFVLYEGQDEAVVQQVAEGVAAFATSEIHPVTSVDQL